MVPSESTVWPGGINISKYPPMWSPQAVQGDVPYGP